MLFLGKAGYPVLISILTGVIELGLIFILVPRYGYLMMATLLSGYFIVSLGFISLRGIIEVLRRKKASPYSSQPLKKEQSPEYPEMSGSREYPAETDDSSATPMIKRQPEGKQHSKFGKMFTGFASPGINHWDLLFILVFLLYAGWYFLGRLEANYPVVILSE